MTLHYPDDEAIAALGEALVARTLPKAAWTHAAHFAAALWLLRQGREGETAGLIRAYNTSVGTPNTDTSGYHETITAASLAAARAHLAAGPPDAPLHESLDRLMAGPMGRPDWLLAYWSKDRLFSAEARRRWARPDLGPLPF